MPFTQRRPLIERSNNAKPERRGEHHRAYDVAPGCPPQARLELKREPVIVFDGTGTTGWPLSGAPARARHTGTRRLRTSPTQRRPAPGRSRRPTRERPKSDDGDSRRLCARRGTQRTRRALTASRTPAQVAREERPSARGQERACKHSDHGRGRTIGRPAPRAETSSASTHAADGQRPALQSAPRGSYRLRREARDARRKLTLAQSTTGNQARDATRPSARRERAPPANAMVVARHSDVVRLEPAPVCS